MSLRFLKTTFALLISSFFLNAIPMQASERSSKPIVKQRIERIIASNLFVVPFHNAASYKRLISPTGVQAAGDPLCWGYLTRDTLLGMGYDDQTASWVGGAAYRSYPDLDPIVYYAVELGVSFEDITLALTNCILYCGWE